ncbi:hypothetical protein FRC12_003625 [Ceratobasidium sp. 428]|nr:hypothetical protein FRC12_003625 [Ceratobasidium sp. 428]
MARRTLSVAQAASRISYIDIPPNVVPPNTPPQHTPAAAAAAPAALPGDEPVPSLLLASLFGLTDVVARGPDE